jgi:hypothetical protein
MHQALRGCHSLPGITQVDRRRMEFTLSAAQVVRIWLSALVSPCIVPVLHEQASGDSLFLASLCSAGQAVLSSATVQVGF